MLSIFIMLFIAIGIAAGIGYAIVTLINTAQTSLTIQANQVRLQNIAIAIRSGLTSDDGSVLLPVSVVNGKVLARIPDSAPFSTTTSGGDIVFCPAFPNPSATSAEMFNERPDGSEERFGVDVVEVAEKTYAKAGHAPEIEGARLARLNEMGVIAYLLAPQPNFKGALECGDIDIADDKYTILVNGGTVMPVYSMTTDARGSVFVLSEDGTKRSGYSGTDRIVRKLSDVTEFVNQYQVADVTVRFPANLDITLSELVDFLKAGESRTLRMVPAQDPNSQDPDSENGGRLAHSTLRVSSPGVADNNVYVAVTGTLAMTDITLQGRGFDIALEAGPTASVSLVDSTVAALTTVGGRIYTSGETVIAPVDGFVTTLSPVVARGGEITMNSSAVPAVDAPDAVTVFTSNAGTINLAYGMRVTANTPAQLYLKENEGRIIVGSSAGTQALNVNRGSGYVIESVLPGKTSGSREVVTNTCANGASSCQADCPERKFVQTGYCSTSNGGSITGFSPSADETSFSCSYGGLLAVPMAPKVTAVCDFR